MTEQNEAIKETNEAPSPSLTDLAQLLKASGDPLRLEILRALSKDSFGVLELADIFEIKQSGLSHHLKILAKAELVSTRKEGNSVFYKRRPIHRTEPFREVKKALFSSADQLGLSIRITQQISATYQRRSQISQTFFSEHAGKLKEQQELIASFEVYADHVKSIIDNTKLPGKHHVMEIGPGEGELLGFLADRFDHVAALDNNEDMLKRAKTLNTSHDNITYYHDDTNLCKTHSEQYDCVIANMVLHHTPSPRIIFSDVSQALKRSGSFIVCDLTQHDQDWTRSACGDQWLGFAPTDLIEWAEEFNLSKGQSDIFALRNGFQIQIHQFVKH